MTTEADKTVAELMALADYFAACEADAYKFPTPDNKAATRDARAALQQAIRRAVDVRLVGHFVQRSGFGPWIEVAAIEDGAMPLYAMNKP